MAYLGQGAEGNFTTTNAKDTFSGNGSTTTFTLSQRGTENNVDVFVNNVRQEPGVAYNIEGNGTSLVFTAAPSTGTNNIYVVNRGPAELSASHPAAQNLEAADGTFTGDLTVDTDTLKVDSTNNRVGIGTSSPSYNLDIQGATDGNVIHRIKNSTAGTSARAGLYIDADDGNKGNLLATSSAYTGVGSWQDATVLNAGSIASGGLIMNSQGGDTKFQRALTEKVRITSSGLTFNGDTAAANALDDYEEGTWTPSYSPLSGSFSSITYNEQNGTYVKIGRLVVVSFDIRTNSVSLGSASSSLLLSGLPFTLNGTQATGQCGAQNGWTTNAPEYWNVSDGGTSGFLRRTNGAGYSDITVSNMSTGSNTGHNRILGCSIAYYTNS